MQKISKRNGRYFLLFLFLVFSKYIIAQTPAITSFSPASGPVGTTVTIGGANFSAVAANNIVYFGAARATVSSSTATSLTVTVPAQSTFEPISVTVNQLTAYSKQPFAVTFKDGNTVFAPTAFAPPIDVAMQNSICYDIRQVVLADFDNDGQTDIAVNDPLTNSIYILKNNGSGAPALFNSAPSITLTTGTTPLQLVAVDFNGDGLKDVAVINSVSNTINIFLNTSSGGILSFGPKIELVTVAKPTAMVVGDLDGDGMPDIAVASNTSNTLSIYRNTTDNTGVKFAAKTDLTVYAPGNIVIHDLNNDGKPELIIAYPTAPAGYSLAILGNASTAGNIAFAKTTTLGSTTLYPKAIAVFDADGDGKPDLLIGSDSELSTFRNTSTDGGSFTFDAQKNYTIKTISADLANRDAARASEPVNFLVNNVVSISVGDLDGDGKPDIGVCYNEGELQTDFSIIKNLSTSGNIQLGVNEEFSAPVPHSLAFADVDGDGKPDVVVASRDASTIYIAKNRVVEPVLTGYKTSDGSTVFITGTNLTKTSAVSIGGNPVTSFIITSETTITATVAPNTSGTISATTPYGTATLHGFTNVPPPVITSFSPASGAVGSSVIIKGANFNASPAGNQVFFGSVKASVTAASATSLTVTVPYGSVYKPISVINNNLTAYSALPFNNTFPGAPAKFTASSFGPKTDIIAGGTHPIGITVADFDGDGNPDIALADNGSVYEGQVFVYKNTGNKQTPFSATPLRLVSGTSPFSVVSGDFDGDGKPDLAVANETAATFSIFKNTSSAGAISFAPKADFGGYDNLRYLYVGDLDGDGKPDLVSVGGDSYYYFSVYHNTTDNGVISFAHKVDYVCNGSTKDIFIGDIDGDGKPDIVVSGFTNSIDIFLNTSINGAISFAKQTTVSTTGGNQGMAVGDLNGDGKLDIALITAANEFSVLKNISTIGKASFDTPVPGVLPDSSFPYYIAINDLDGDGKPDIVVSNGNNISSVSVFRNTSSLSTLSFDIKADYTAGLLPEIAALADFNHDGQPDMAVAVNNTHGFSLLTNQVTGPNIDSYQVTVGASTNTVQLTGSNLLGATSVTFGGVAASSFTVVSNTQITAVVSKTAAGTISVVTPNGTATLTGFANLPAPVITSYTVTQTTPGPTVVITGDFLTGATSVTFGGVKASSFVVNSAQQITAIAASATLGDITVVTPGGTVTKTYINTSQATLAGLSTSTGTLSPAFAAATLNYTANVPNATASFIITPTATDANATITVNGAGVKSGAASGNIALAVGSNTVTIVVTSQDGTTTKTYGITVTRAATSAVTLTTLTVNAGVLSPAFAATTTNYTVTVPYTTTAIAFTPGAGDATSTIKVNGTAVTSGSASGSVSLTPGQNTITIAITSQDGVTSQTYTIVVTRSASSVATLANLVTSAGTLSPVFAPLTTNYTVSVPNTTASVFITPTATDANAIIRVNGTVVASSVASSVITLVTGSNTITAAVTAQDGVTTKSYRLIVTRAAAPAVPTLANLVSSTGTLSPAFTPDVTQYTLTVPAKTTGFTLTATATDPASPINIHQMVIASGSATGIIPVTAQPDTIKAVVVAADGSRVNVYTINVKQATGPDATLANLGISAGTLSPVFAPSNYSYTVNVPITVTGLVITPTATDANAKIQINGVDVVNGAAAGSVPLKTGSNTITIVVTAADGITTQSYTLTVTRADLASVSTLANLIIGSVTLSPGFTTDNTTYLGVVINATGSVRVIAVATDLTENIAVNGTPVASDVATGDIALSEGRNTITILVTAQDGISTHTYIATIVRLPTPMAVATGPTSLRDGASVTLVASPTGPYNYQWYNNGSEITGATGSSFTTDQSGSYAVSIGLNGIAQASLSVQVTAIAVDNFKLAVNSATCKGSNNGSVTITGAQSNGYTATITGNGLNATYPFTTTTVISDLSTGLYTICITSASDVSYSQCFTINVTEPKDLSVYSVVDPVANKLTLNLSGAAVYYVKFNGVTTATTDSMINIPLAKGVNTLSVTTDKACQGSFEKSIYIGDGITLYPNPFSSSLSLDMGQDSAGDAQVDIYSVTGALVYHKSFTGAATTLHLDVSSLRANSAYTLKLTIGKSVHVVKIIKQ